MILKPSIIVSSAGGGGADPGLAIPNSGLFTKGGNTRLTRTTSGTPTDSTTFTLSTWIKRTEIGSGDQYIFSTDSTEGIKQETDVFTVSNGGATVGTHKLRDPADFYHLVVQVDTGLADKFNLFLDNVELPISSTANPSSWLFNGVSKAAVIGDFGALNIGMGSYCSEFVLVDGLVLPPSDFAEESASGRWRPIDVSGLTFGNNGFYLDFQDGTDLGKDVSGQANHWTNTGVTQSTDSPSRNLPTFGDPENPIVNITQSEGNTAVVMNVTNQEARTGHQVDINGSTGYYFEVVPDAAAITVGFRGIILEGSNLQEASTGASMISILTDGSLMVNGVATAVTSPQTFTTGDVVGIAYGNSGELYYSVNGTYANSGSAVLTGKTGQYAPFCSRHGGSSPKHTFTFSSDDWVHTPPTDFVELSASTLDASAVNPQEHFKPLTYTGNGASSRALTGVGFTPELAWIKERNGNTHHYLYDQIRGVTKSINSNQTIAEVTDTKFGSFDSDGFTLGTTVTDVNTNTQNYVAWLWNMAESTSANTDGTISSTVSTGIDQGMSIVSYTGTGANATVGHGLGIAPSMIIVKNRDSVRDWDVFHKDVGNTKILFLNLTNAETTSTSWNNTSPTASVFSLGAINAVNESGSAHIAYCFTDIEGFSKASSYTGNGSVDGPFIFLGFRPAYILIKVTGFADNWMVVDNARDTENPVTANIKPNSSAAELQNESVDLLSNGFKLRAISGETNSNGANYIYMAFAHNPFSR